ncbi:MAG: S-layer homology domain-containing protein [Clostridia bacterium]|nr:S-layer homology domain-containing protein [Clostridia bacterium]
MKIKRFSVMLLVLIYTFACIPVSGYDATNASNTTYDEMLGTLVALDIIGEDEVESFTPDTNVTRAQMVVMAMRLLRVNTVGLSEEFDRFYDVPPEHEAYNEILMAHKLGIISGVDNERFDPQGTVSYEQAVKILVATLGYEQAAQQKGGYPEGYLAVAMRADLLDGVTVENKAALSHKSVVQMVYNALETNMFDAEYYLSGGDYVEKIQEGVTLLEDRLEIKTVRGVVTQNNITGISSASTVSKEQVMINGEVYFVGNTAIADYLGYNVKVYYKDEPIKEIIYFSHTEKYNEMLTLNDKDDLEISYDGTKFTFSYTDEKGNRRDETSSGSCIYNGVYTNKIRTADPADTDVMADINGKSLSVKLIDNNLDSSYDVILLDAYEAYLVNTVSVANERVRYNVLGADRSMRVDEINISKDNGVEHYNVYDADGRRAELDVIEANDVVSIYRDLSNKVYTLRISKMKITGEILEISDDSEYTIRVDDENASTSDGEVTTFDAYYKKSPAFPSELLKLGLRTTFYLDADGNIAAYEIGNATEGDYGIIMGYGAKSGIRGTSEFKILTAGGNVVILETEKEITAYNPATRKVQKTKVADLVKKAEEVAEADKPYYLWLTENQAAFDFEGSTDAGSDNPAKPFYYRPWLTEQEKSDIASRKMVYYKTNGDGRISTILVPDLPDTVDIKYRKLRLMNGPGRYGYTYVSAQQMFYDSNAGDDSVTGGVNFIKLADNAKIFSCIALDYSENNFVVMNSKILNSVRTKMWLYAIEGSTQANLVLHYKPLPREHVSSMPLVVVKNVATMSDGSYQIRGFSKGVEYTATIAPDTRLIETQLSSSSSNLQPLKQEEIFDYIPITAGGEGKDVYDYSLCGGSSSYADPDSIRPGDIIVVGKDRSNEARYIEIVMRAKDGVHRYPNNQSSFAGRWKGDNIRKGIVTGFLPSGEILINSIGYVSDRAEMPSKSINTFYYDRKVPNDIAKCKSIWKYDYISKTIEAATHSDLMIGDIVMIDGAALAPVDCIILRNYKWDELPLAQWEPNVEIPEDPLPVLPDLVFERFSTMPSRDGATIGGNATYTKMDASFKHRKSESDETDKMIGIPFAGAANRAISIKLNADKAFKINSAYNSATETYNQMVFEWDMMFKETPSSDETLTFKLKNGDDLLKYTGFFGLAESATAGTKYTCRMVVNKSDMKAEFFLNGTSKGTLEPTAAGKTATSCNEFMIHTTKEVASGENEVYIDNLRISEQTGAISGGGSSGGGSVTPPTPPAVTYPINLFNANFDSYTENQVINGKNLLAGNSGTGDFVATTVSGNKGVYTEGKNNSRANLSETVTLGTEADATTETVVELDLCRTKGFDILLRNGGTDICALRIENNVLKLAATADAAKNETVNKVENVTINGDSIVHIKIVIDEKYKTADLYVGENATPALTDVPIAGDVNAVNRFMVKYNAADGKLWIDNINIYRQLKS